MCPAPSPPPSPLLVGLQTIAVPRCLRTVHRQWRTVLRSRHSLGLNGGECAMPPHTPREGLGSCSGRCGRTPAARVYRSGGPAQPPATL